MPPGDIDPSPAKPVARNLPPARKASRRWLWTAGWCTLLIIVGLVAWWYRWNPRLERPFTVRHGDIIRSYSGHGRFESKGMIEVVPPITARIDRISVEEGDLVEAGQLLVELDASVLLAELAEAEFALAAVRSQRDDVLAGTRADALATAAAKVAELLGESHRAESEVAELERGTRSEELREAEADVALARVEVASAEKSLKRSESLKEFASEQEIDEARRQRDAMQSRLEKALARREARQNGATPEERSQAKAAAAAARARLAQAESQLAELKSYPTAEARRLAGARCDQAQATVDRLQALIAQTRLYSPARARVLRRYAEASELAHPHMDHPILVLADLDRVRIRLEVEEEDVYKLRVGQSATITSDSYLGEQWTGTVVELAPVLGRKRLFSEDPGERSDVKVLEAWVQPDGELAVPFHVPMEVRVVDVVREQVLVIPSRAFGPDGRVHLADGTSRAIINGACDDGMVEVVSGLSEGEVILLPEP